MDSGYKHEEVDKISKSLGKDIKYFMQDNLALSETIYEDPKFIIFHTDSVDFKKRISKNYI